jgi:hypothetical protein
MPQAYYQGYKGRFVLNTYPDNIFTFSSWTYRDENRIIDITNTYSNGKEQFIENLVGGTITGDGFLTQLLYEEVASKLLKPGQEIKVNLYLNWESNPKLGFTSIDAVIQDFETTVDVSGTAKFTLNALVSDPKL